MSDAMLLAELARVKATFQLRAICTVIGIDPSHRELVPTGATASWSADGEAISPRLPVRSADIAPPTQFSASANVGEDAGQQLADASEIVVPHGGAK